MHLNEVFPAQQFSNTENNVGTSGSHNGQMTGNSTTLSNKIPVSSQQLGSAIRENLHSVTCGMF